MPAEIVKATVSERRSTGALSNDSRTEGFSIYALDHPHIARTVRGRLIKRQQELVEQLVAAQNWPDFCERRGVIRGLVEAIGECEKTEEEQ